MGLLLSSSSRCDCFRVSASVSSERSVIVVIFSWLWDSWSHALRGFWNVFLKALCSFQHVSFGRRDLWRQNRWSRKCGPEVHQCCVLFLWTMNVHLVHFSFMLMYLFDTFFRRVRTVYKALCVVRTWNRMVVFTSCRGLPSPTEFLRASRTESSLVACTITSLLFVSSLRTVIDRSVHHLTHDAVLNELCIGALVVHTLCWQDVKDSLGSCQSGWRGRARRAQVHFLSFSTSLVCLIVTVHLVYEFGHVAEMVLISNTISFSTISSLEVRGSREVCCTVSICTTGVRNNDWKSWSIIWGGCLHACSPRLCIWERSVVKRSGWWSSLKETMHNSPCACRHLSAWSVLFLSSSCCAWFGTIVVVSIWCDFLESLATLFFCGHLSEHGVCEMVTIRMRVCHYAFCVRLERLVRLFLLRILIWGVAALFQKHIGGFSLAIESAVLERICDDVSVSEASWWLARLLVFRLVTVRKCGTFWATVRYIREVHGCLQSTVSMRGVPIIDRLFFLLFIFWCSGSRLLLAWSASRQIASGWGAEEAILCFNVWVFSSSWSAMLKDALRVRWVMCNLFLLLSRRARWWQRFLVDSHSVWRHVFRAARILARHTSHGALLVCLCLRFMVGVVFVFVESSRVSQSFDKCVLREVGHYRDFFMVVGQLESRFTWVLKGVFLEGEICGDENGGRANTGQRFVSVPCSFFFLTMHVHLVHFPFTLMYLFWHFFRCVRKVYNCLCVVRTWNQWCERVAWRVPLSHAPSHLCCLCRHSYCDREKCSPPHPRRSCQWALYRSIRRRALCQQDVKDS